MDDPTRRCENDTGNETRLSGPPIPSGGLFFDLLSVFMFRRSTIISTLTFVVSFGHELPPPEVAGLKQ
jgi:hypothetical protein